MRHFRGAPDIRGAFLAVGVRVQAGGEGGPDHAQLACREVERGAHYLGVRRVGGDLPGVQVDARELRVVIQHLLEVRHQPQTVGGIACKAASKLVVDAASGHGVKSAPYDLERSRVTIAQVLPEQQLERHGRREPG